MISVLCVHSKSIYKTMAGVDAWDAARDVRNYRGTGPIVAHPPCRSWSAFTAHQAKPLPGEKELGYYCADWLNRYGGVLEHPAHSRLFAAAGLPLPGETRGHLTTIQVNQSWWGYPTRKATWLCFSHCTPQDIPYREHDSSAGVGDARRFSLMSRYQRAASVPALADWLVASARRTVRRAGNTRVP